MRAIVLLIIAAAAGVIGSVAITGECQDGTWVRSEEHCRERLTQGLCQMLFSRAKEVAQTSNSVYTDPVECSRLFGSCLPHATILSGYVPVPAGFCARTNGETLLSMEPVYRRRGVN